jgi:hypothetical protein
MTWYNPISWFKKDPSASVRLVCDNMQCGENITDSRVLYDAERDKVYHDNGCARIGMALLALSCPGKIMYGNVDCVPRASVVNIRNSKGLDKKVEEVPLA